MCRRIALLLMTATVIGCDGQDTDRVHSIARKAPEVLDLARDRLVNIEQARRLADLATIFLRLLAPLRSAAGPC